MRRERRERNEEEKGEGVKRVREGEIGPPFRKG